MKETYEEILEANMKYINFIAYSMKVRNKEIIADLIQEGKISLWNSYKTYDEKLNIGFINYAGKRAKWDMIRYMQKNLRTIYIPKCVLEDKEHIEHILEDTKTISISTPINEYGDVLSDITPEVEQEPQIDTELFKSILIASIKKPRDREMIMLKYGIDTYKPLTYAQLTMIYGSSRQNICGIIQRNLTKLKHNEAIKRIF